MRFLAKGVNYLCLNLVLIENSFLIYNKPNLVGLRGERREGQPQESFDSFLHKRDQMYCCSARHNNIAGILHFFVPLFRPLALLSLHI